MNPLDISIELLPTQRRFLNSDQPFPAYIGGYGAGKTFINSVKAIIHAAYHNPGLAGMLVAPNYRDLRDTNIPTLLELLDRFTIPFVLHKTNYDLELPWWNSRILLRSADDPEKLKGPNIAWAGIDEVARTQESLWGVVVSRVRHPKSRFKQAFVTGTPEGLNWVFEQWVENKEAGYELFQASTRENIYLDSAYIQFLQNSHDEHETRQKLEGQFSAGIKGRAYKNFKREIHLLNHSPLINKGEAVISPHLPICISCDFNVDPCCWIILQHHHGTVYIIDEVVLRETSTQEMIDECRQRRYLDHKQGVIIYGDPAGRARRTVSGGSDYALLQGAGLRNLNVARHAPTVRDRILSVNHMFEDADKKPHLFINSACTTLIKDLERVTWKEGSASSIDKSDIDLTHASDALGYFIHQEYGLTRRKAPRPTKVTRILGSKRI
jgi:PBSX family phage terminase large subunit